MNLLELIFNLSIVYVVYNFIWWLLIKIPVSLITGFKPYIQLNYAVSAVRYLILSSLTYSNCYIHSQKNLASLSEISITYLIGGVFLALYLAGKLNKKTSILNMVSNLGSKLNINASQNKKQKYESHILGVSIVIYAACIGVPKFGNFLYQNPINIWFISTIEGLYLAPILKGVFGILGFFFMVSSFQKGVVTVSTFINKITGKKKKAADNPLEEMMKNFNEKNNNGNKSSEKVDLEEDIYVDFEEVDEQEN
jgi:hypothetical protein